MNMNNNFDTKKYWENRYAIGGNSGSGSYGKLAEFKAGIINTFIKENGITKAIEFGCGDGYQLSLFKIHEYTGIDISKTAIGICKEQFKGDKTKRFFIYDPHSFKNKNNFEAELILSLDVIYHLIEDDIFELYMKHLFLVSNKYVIIYSSNNNNNSMFQSYHCKNRRFSEWIKINLPGWELTKKIKNKYPGISRSNFYIYKKMEERD